MSSHCLQDLNLTLAGPKFLSECINRNSKLDIAYMGLQTVEIEVVKRVVLIEIRGDTVPDHEKDTVVIHLGGLPKEMVKVSKHRQVVRGVTAMLSQNVTREFKMGGRRRNKYKKEKQIIHLGISHTCYGTLQLRDVGNKKVLQCVETKEDRISNDQGANSELIQLVRHVPKKSRSKFKSYEITDTGKKIKYSRVKHNKIKDTTLQGLNGTIKATDEKTDYSVEAVEKTNLEETSFNITETENNVPSTVKDPSRADVVEIDNTKVESLEQEVIEIKGKEKKENTETTDSDEEIGWQEVQIEIRDKKPAKHSPGNEVEESDITLTIDTSDTLDVSITESKIEHGHDHNASRTYIIDVGKESSTDDQELIELHKKSNRTKQKPLNNNEKPSGNNVLAGQLVVEISDKSPANAASNEEKQTNKIETDNKQQGQLLVEIRDKKPATLRPTINSHSNVKEKIVSIADSTVNDRIKGHVFEIQQSHSVKARDKGKYVEVSFGTACSSQMEVNLIGSTFYCTCENHNVTVKYIGKGPTDIEVAHTTFMVDGEEWNGYQNEDFILLYVGGIPKKLKQKNTKTVILRGVTAQPIGRREQRIVEVVGPGPPMKRYQRQILIMGISRQCDDYLFTTSVSGKQIVECAQVHQESINYFGQSPTKETSREVVISGQSSTREESRSEEVFITGLAPIPVTQAPVYHHELPVIKEETKIVTQDISHNEVIRPMISKIDTVTEHTEKNNLQEVNKHGHTSNHITGSMKQESGAVERMFTVSGMKSMDISSNQNFHISFQSPGCHSTEMFEITAVESNLEIGCGLKQERVNVNYIGRNPTDIYLSRSIHVLGKGSSEIEHGVSVFMGGKTAKEFQQRNVVEVIKRVSGGASSGTRRVIRFGGISRYSKDEVAVVDVGFSEGCDGTLQEHVENEQIVISCNHGIVEKVVEISGQTAVEEAEKHVSHNVIISGKGKDSEKQLLKHNITRKIIVDVVETRPQVHTEKEVRTTTAEPFKFEKIVLTGTQEQVAEEQNIDQEENSFETVTQNNNIVVVTNDNKESTETELVGTVEAVRPIETDVQSINGSLDTQKIFFISRAQFVNINKTQQSIDIGFIRKCGSNYNVASHGKHLRITCQHGRYGAIDLEFHNEEATDIEVSTTVRLEKHDDKENAFDKIFIQLGGIKQYISNNVAHLSLNQKDNSVNNIVFVNGLSDSKDDTHIKVVEIGIKKSCKDGTLDKYVDLDGTFVFCQRRADILPEDNGYEMNITPTINKDIFEHPVLTSTRIPELSVNTGSGEYIEARSLDKKTGNFTVTSETVDGSGKAILAPVIDTSRSIPAHKIFNRDKLVKFEGAETNLGYGTNERRADVSVEEVYRDYSSNLQQHTYTNPKSSPNEPLMHFDTSDGEKHRRVDLHINESLEINVGNNCKGKIEAMETDSGVMVKCTVGGETLELNLVGFGKIGSGQSHGQFLPNVQNDESVKLNVIYSGENGFITEKMAGFPGGVTMRHVYFASPMRKAIAVSDTSPANRDSEQKVWYNGFQSDDPHTGLINFPVLLGPRRGDLEWDDVYFPEGKKKRRKRNVGTES